MRRSEHYGPRHPAVAAVACPVCEVAKGVPCVRARDRRPREGHGTETHVGRVRKFESQQEQNPFAGYEQDDQAAAASANYVPPQSNR